MSFQISHNVPAVYDVLPARIRACVARQGWQNVSGVERGRRSRPRGCSREEKYAKVGIWK
jgi:hypothetical protein